MKQIECELGLGDTNIRYLPYGTKGYLKTNDNEIRECICLGGKWDRGMKYEWKVAGFKEHFFGTHSRIGQGEVEGILYMTQQLAQRGKSDTRSSYQKGELQRVRELSIHNFLRQKYGLATECFRMSGTWSNWLEVKAYGINKDNSVGPYVCDFDVVLTKEGIDVIVPALEDKVSENRRYATKEQAYAAAKPLKVYTLDDENVEVEEKKSVKVRMTIEVEVDEVEKVKAMGGVIVVKES